MLAAQTARVTSAAAHGSCTGPQAHATQGCLQQQQQHIRNVDCKVITVVDHLMVAVFKGAVVVRGVALKAAGSLNKFAC
jgi:predicted carbohydrate-binding protein with CBM5 and CBM33 domain